MRISDWSSDVCSSDLDMEREALITREEEWYRSTRLGQVARQQLMTQQGLTTEPLSKQTNYCPADLILAIAASHKVSLEFQSEVIEKKEFDVYLHEFTSTQIQAELEIGRACVGKECDRTGSTRWEPHL